MLSRATVGDTATAAATQLPSKIFALITEGAETGMACSSNLRSRARPIVVAADLLSGDAGILRAAKGSGRRMKAGTGLRGEKGKGGRRREPPNG